MAMKNKINELDKQWGDKADWPSYPQGRELNPDEKINEQPCSVSLLQKVHNHAQLPLPKIRMSELRRQALFFFMPQFSNVLL